MGNTKCFVAAGVVGAVVILIISLVATSLEKLSSYEVGLKYDTVWKKLDDEPIAEGLHTGSPGFIFIKFPSVFKSLDYSGLHCLNKDGVATRLTVSFQYRAQPRNLYRIVTQFNDHDGYKRVLLAVGAAVIHEACSLYNTSQFQAERGNFQTAVGERLIERYSELYCDVSAIQVSNIARAGAYEDAIRAKESARENIKVAENERPRKILQAETKEREAMTQAEITVTRAESRARIVLSQARAEADAILDAFEKEAETYEELLSSSGLGLTKEGFLSYMGIRAISNAHNPVTVGLKSPAKTSYVVQ